MELGWVFNPWDKLGIENWPFRCQCIFGKQFAPTKWGWCLVWLWQLIMKRWSRDRGDFWLSRSIRHLCLILSPQNQSTETERSGVWVSKWRLKSMSFLILMGVSKIYPERSYFTACLLVVCSFCTLGSGAAQPSPKILPLVLEGYKS